LARVFIADRISHREEKKEPNYSYKRKYHFSVIWKAFSILGYPSAHSKQNAVSSNTCESFILDKRKISIDKRLG
jgi:hypothetical protein